VIQNLSGAQDLARRILGKVHAFNLI